MGLSWFGHCHLHFRFRRCGLYSFFFDFLFFSLPLFLVLTAFDFLPLFPFLPDVFFFFVFSIYLELRDFVYRTESEQASRGPLNHSRGFGYKNTKVLYLTFLVAFPSISFLLDTSTQPAKGAFFEPWFRVAWISLFLELFISGRGSWREWKMIIHTTY